MKILFVGQLAEGQTSRMRMEVLEGLGHAVVGFDSQRGWQACGWLSRHVQQAAALGPIISRFNREVLEAARRHRPDVLWGEKQEYLRPETLDELRTLGIQLIHFTPDPYFTLRWKRTRLMDECMPRFDVVITSKRYELDEYRRVCRRVVYMPLGFAEAVHRPLFPRDPLMHRRFSSEIGFVGGWEPRREALLGELAKAGCDVKIWGTAWDQLIDGRWTPRRAARLWRLAGKQSFSIGRNARLAACIQGGEVYGDAYAWALSGAAISVGFLRQVCPDEHTTRTFEIPACGSMLLADRTPEHQAFFTEGEEAEFFSSAAELLDKARFYVTNEAARTRVARAGYRRCHSSGYSYRERLVAVLQELS
jgi:spore maturation protein CgeB